MMDCACRNTGRRTKTPEGGEKKRSGGDGSGRFILLFLFSAGGTLVVKEEKGRAVYQQG